MSKWYKIELYTDEDVQEVMKRVNDTEAHLSNVSAVEIVKAEKHTYFITFFDDDGQAGEYLLKRDYDFTPDQAAKVSAAMEAFMEYLLYKGSDWVEKWRHLDNLMDEARKSLNND